MLKIIVFKTGPNREPDLFSEQQSCGENEGLSKLFTSTSPAKGFSRGISSTIRLGLGASML